MQQRSETPLDALLVRLADGDRSAFDPVFTMLWPVVRSFCARTLGNVADADDAAQVTMQKLFLQVGQYDPSRSGVGWAIAIASWECRTIRRRAVRQRTVPLAGEPANAHASPEETIIREDLEAAVREAIETLPNADRCALRAVLEEIANEGAPSAMMRKRKQRALARLKDVWRRLHGT